MKWSELVNRINAHNKEHNITTQYEDKNPLSCVVVISNDSFDGIEYSLESRSYRFRSDEKFFLSKMMGRSIFADSLDGSDPGIRLDWYLFDGKNCWQIEDCYIEGE